MTQPLSFTGVWPILATPFFPDETVDRVSLTRLVDFMARLGVNGVTVLGVLGESNRLLDDERRQIIETAVAAAGGRIPVIAGVSHPGTHATIGLARMAATTGAAAIMVAPGHEPVPDESRVLDYFRRVVGETGLPLVVQDHPASTQVHLSVPLLLRLVQELSEVACIKAEATPTPPKIAALKAGMTSRRVPILTGLGALYGEFDLARGSDGFNTGFAFPEALMALVAARQRDDRTVVHDLYQRFLPLIVFEQQPGVAIRKELLRRRGLISHATVRHPGSGLPTGVATQLDQLLHQTFGDQDLTQPLQIFR